MFYFFHFQMLLATAALNPSFEFIEQQVSKWCCYYTKLWQTWTKKWHSSLVIFVFLKPAWKSDWKLQDDARSFTFQNLDLLFVIIGNYYWRASSLHFGCKRCTAGLNCVNCKKWQKGHHSNHNECLPFEESAIVCCEQVRRISEET